MKDEVQYVPSSSIVGLIYKKVYEKEIQMAQEDNDFSSVENGALRADETYSYGNNREKGNLIETWTAHLQDFKSDFMSYKGKYSLMDCSVKYNELVRKYIRFFLQDAEGIYQEMDTWKSVKDMDEEDAEYLRAKARKELASIVYNVTYNESALRFFGGLSFCWKVCGNDLHSIRFSKTKKLSKQCSHDSILNPELVCLLTSLRNRSKRR